MSESTRVYGYEEVLQETAAVRFFYDHAGWSYHPDTETPHEGRLRGARALAKAERWAQEAGISFYWDFDTEGDEPEPGYVFMRCDAYTDGLVDGGGPQVVTSIGGIDEREDQPNLDYRRVIEAELALEAMEEANR